MEAMAKRRLRHACRRCVAHWPFHRRDAPARRRRGRARCTAPWRTWMARSRARSGSAWAWVAGQTRRAERFWENMGYVEVRKASFRCDGGPGERHSRHGENRSRAGAIADYLSRVARDRPEAPMRPGRSRRRRAAPARGLQRARPRSLCRDIRPTTVTIYRLPATAAGDHGQGPASRDFTASASRRRISMRKILSRIVMGNKVIDL